MKKQPEPMTPRTHERDEDWSETSQERERLQAVARMIQRQLEEANHVVDVSGLPWQFEWTVVPGPETIQ